MITSVVVVGLVGQLGDWRSLLGRSGTWGRRGRLGRMGRVLRVGVVDERGRGRRLPAPAGRVSRVVYYEAREAGGLESDILLHLRIIVV